MTGISSRQKEQSEPTCVFLGGPPAKQHALFAVEGTMVFLFNTSTSESLSELREVRVKRQRGEREKHVRTKATC